MSEDRNQMTDARPWISCEDELPPDGEIVETRSPGGIVQALKRDGGLWFVPDGTIYVYYTPVAWRPPAPPPSTAESPASTTGQWAS
jgi:hypothetical protein